MMEYRQKYKEDIEWEPALKGIEDLFIKDKHEPSGPLVWKCSEGNTYITLAIDFRCISYVMEKLDWLDLISVGPLPTIYGNTDYLTCVFKKD